MKSRTKKMEFSKKLVAWALVTTSMCIAMSYILALMGRDPTGDVTISVVTTCVAIAVAYEAKSFGEKNSRNKYGVDRQGNKIGVGRNTDDEPLG